MITAPPVLCIDDFDFQRKIEFDDDAIYRNNEDFSLFEAGLWQLLNQTWVPRTEARS
jgi:hypothetical protein